MADIAYSNLVDGSIIVGVLVPADQLPSPAAASEAEAAALAVFNAQFTETVPPPDAPQG